MGGGDIAVSGGTLDENSVVVADDSGMSATFSVTASWIALII